MGFLTQAVERVRRELERHPPADDGSLLRAESMPPPLDFAAALRAPGIGIIAEVKRASPSAGEIADADPAGQAAAYEAGGAVAVSVLTETAHFSGSLADLRLSRRATALPLLRKDFIVHPAQVLEARVNGADAVLLIAAVLSEGELRDLREVADGFGLAALVEVHTEAELDRAAASGAAIVGVNARDLETLDVDRESALRLLSTAPADRIRVLESGVREAAHVAAARDAGADAVLVGEALMRSDDPARALRELAGT
jgi:indole-3-glycerol phosphate synthase